MKNLNKDSSDKCPHTNIKRDRRFLVCRDCGLILDENIDFIDNVAVDQDSQLQYERNIRIRDSKAKQDPLIKKKYDRLKVLEVWYKDSQTNFTEQKNTIEFLKSYGINIDPVKFQNIKKRYLKYNRKHRKTYQNMVIVFLAIVWMEIKETTNVRIEQFIKACQELSHKINKKMLNNAMLKVKNTEKLWKKYKNVAEIEKEIKNRIKILFQKNLNGISYDKVKEYIRNKNDYDKLKIDMQLLADKFLKKIPYEKIRNLNYKAFTAGLIYYIGQTLNNRKIFTQNIIEEITKYSSTTIRKKFNILKEILGSPKEYKNLILT